MAFVVPRYGADVVGGAETLVRGLAEHLAAAGSAGRGADDLRARPPHVEERAPARREPRGGRGRSAASRCGSATRGGTPGSSSASSGGSRLRPRRRRAGRRSRWRARSSSTTSPRRQGRATTWSASPRTCSARRSRGVPLVPGAGRPDPVPPRRAVRPPRASSGEVFQACRGFIFNSPPEAALAEKLYGIGDRPVRRRGARLRSRRRPPTRRRSAGATASRARSSSTSAGRRRGRTSPSSSSTPSATAPSAGADLTLVLAGDGPVTAPPGTPGVRDLGYLDAAEQGRGLRGRHGRLPAVGQRVVLDRPDGGLARGDAGPRPRPLRGHDPPRPPAPAAASPSRTSTSSPRRSTCSSRTRERRGRLGGQGRAYVEAEYSWPAVTARLHETLERLVA